MNSLLLHLATALALLLLACSGEAPGSDEPADLTDSGMETSLPDSPVEPVDASADALGDVTDADAVDAPLDQDGPEITPIDTPWGELNQSCASLSANHCEEAFVKGGSYTMGMIGASGVDGKLTEEDLRPVTLTDFYIDTHEVTVARFRAFFEAGMPTPPEGLVIAPGILWEDRFNQYIDEPGWVRYENPLPPPLGSNDNPIAPFERRCPNASSLHCACTWAWANDQVDDDDPFAPTPPDEPSYFENKALNCINWYTAAAFCAWDGKRLPTEAEWEFVGRNRGQDIKYPWGDTLPTCEQAITGAPDSPTSCPDQFRYWPGDVATAPEGDTHDPTGVHDMVGGVGEWMADVYQSYRNEPGCWSEGAYGVDPLCSWEKDPPLWKPPAFHTLRGADWRGPPSSISSRYTLSAQYSRHWTGFRCARKE